MMDERYDVAIVGGGPAGCSAAIALAQAGVRVILFEARPYPHDTLCGEFLSPECGPLLARLGMPGAPAILGALPIERTRISAPDGKTWDAPLPGLGWALSRCAFDAALVAKARADGASVREGQTVTAIRGNLRQGFELDARSGGQHSTVKAHTVVAAHGKRAALDRSLQRAFLDRPQSFMALKAHFNGTPLPGRVELHAFRGGYCGLSTVEDGTTNLCLLVEQTVYRAASGAAPAGQDGFVAWMQERNPHLGAWLRHAKRADDRWIGIAQVPFMPKQVTAGDVLLTGDAAGLIVPLAGDGIAMALQGGLLAAKHIYQHLRGAPSSGKLPDRYAAAWRREFEPRLRLGRLLQPFLLSPALAAFGLRFVRLIPPLGAALIGRTRGKEAHRGSIQEML